MTRANATEEHDVILGLGAKKRLAFMFETVQQYKQVWPTREFAQAWATGDWEGCTPKAIPTSDWFSRWTPGLEEDDLLIAVFPTEEDDGTILFPDEFERQLKAPKKKY